MLDNDQDLPPLALREDPLSLQAISIEEEKWDIKFVQLLKESGNQGSIMNSGIAMKWEEVPRGPIYGNSFW